MVTKKKQMPRGAPDWMVTYGDMMTLLLCFFVILVSMSEMKKDRRFQEVMDSIRAAFGYDGTVGVVPTISTSRNSLVEQLRRVVLPDYIKREGDSDEEGIDGRVFRVTNVREGVNLQVGGRVSFERFGAVLKPGAEALISSLAGKVVGHNTIIKVRGHATLEPLPPDSPFRDPMDLSIARARAVAGVMQRHGIRPERLRIVGVGSTEPLVAQAYTETRRALNRRVEIIVTEAIVGDYAGAPVQNEERDSDHGA
ncbi:MAG: flagellar motor protein MotB [Phycisphaerae bacterium]